MGQVVRDLFFGTGWVARSTYRKMVAGEQLWAVEKETFGLDMTINMNGSEVLDASRGCIYVIEFETGSCSLPERNGRNVLARSGAKRRRL